MDDHVSQGEDIGSRTATNVPPEEVHVQERSETQQDRTTQYVQRHQDTQAAFFANSELVAVTPRQSVWTGGNPLARDEAKLPANSPLQSVKDEAHSNPAGIEINNETDWRPSLSIGSIDTCRLSAKEAARRYMLQWEHIWEYHRVHSPHSLQVIEEQRDEARKEYEDICVRQNPEDVVPKNKLRSFQEERIEARIALLRQTLEHAEPEGTEHMRRNIAAALHGYATGALGFSNTYALIYAGQIVDTSCTSYAEFTEDRQDRLDRYFAQCGTGYLWWEPPLARGKERISAKKGTALELGREDDVVYHQHYGGARFRDDTCHFKISLGFQKDNSLRFRKGNRLQKEKAIGSKRKWDFIHNSDDQNSAKRHGNSSDMDTTQMSGESLAEGKKLRVISPQYQTARPLPSAPLNQVAEPIQEEGPGPPVFFDMLLDSGAEIPMLLHSDFRLLGYTKKDMNAASVIDLNMAAGQNATALCFELLVGLDLHGPAAAAAAAADGDDKNSTHHVHPERQFFPTRVVKLGPAIKPPPSGGYSGDRLSGILPFLAYYVSCAPGRDQIWMGEERADVLGMQKFPAGLRYDPFRRVEMGQQTRDVFKQAGPSVGLRKVTFEHEVQGGRMLVDRDIVSRVSRETRSRVTLLEADGKLAASWEMGGVHQGEGQWKKVEHS